MADAPMTVVAGWPTVRRPTYSLGDGEFDYREAVKRSRPVRTGIGSDTGGGTSFSIPRQLGEAYKEVAMLRTAVALAHSKVSTWPRAAALRRYG